MRVRFQRGRNGRGKEQKLLESTHDEEAKRIRQAEELGETIPTIYYKAQISARAQSYDDSIISPSIQSEFGFGSDQSENGRRMNEWTLRGETIFFKS